MSKLLSAEDSNVADNDIIHIAALCYKAPADCVLSQLLTSTLCEYNLR